MRADVEAERGPVTEHDRVRGPRRRRATRTTARSRRAPARAGRRSRARRGRRARSVRARTRYARIARQRSPPPSSASQRGGGPCELREERAPASGRAARARSRRRAPCASSIVHRGCSPACTSDVRAVDVDERAVRAASRQPIAVRARRAPRRACRASSRSAAPAARASRCRSWLPSTHVTLSLVLARPAQHVERARPAVDEIADEPQLIVGGEKSISASSRSRLAMQPWMSPIA